ncbi:L-dopachrome tautomerase-related protein [Entomobacter blattae]|uniref:Major royal jelly protein n=1 Tax=Entomobacter blattae TaxID=2762277 RepID=A0A7H1NRC7_9PROT|nr:L-dopachrome tautomerase-related protein [Entomobacter blattae]QNT78337.1 Major royal jelly protein [Entomobacter blattae]
MIRINLSKGWVLAAFIGFCLLWALPSQAVENTAVTVSGKGHLLQKVAEFEQFRLLGIAVSHEGRIFASAPLGDQPKVVEVMVSTGALKPFPDLSWNQEKGSAQHRWVVPQALWVDKQNHLWVLDSGKGQVAPKLVEFSLITGGMLRSYGFGSTVSAQDSLNDVRIDTKHHYAYLTNVGGIGGLVVLNLQTGESRQVLKGDPSTHSEAGQYLSIGDQPAIKGGKILILHADGIALSHDEEWLYYRPLTDHNYWRIKTEALRNSTLSAESLSAKVQFLGKGPMTGGLIIDQNNTLYGGDLEHSTVVAMKYSEQTGQLQTRLFATSPELSWADGFAIHDGYLYVADSHLWEYFFDNSRPISGPYAIFRTPLAP